MNNLVTCIITTYNREVDILIRALSSILNQTYRNIEIIIVNDCPENIELNTKINKVLKSLFKDDNIKYIVHEKNKGACAARNTALNIAKGDFIAFLDDDDEWVNTKLEKMLPLFNNDNVVLVYSYCYTEMNNIIRLKKFPFYENNQFEHLLSYNYVNSTSFPVIKKDALLKSGCFDTGFKSQQDWDMWLRVSQLGKFQICKEPLTYYHAQDESISTNMSNKIQGHNNIFNKYEKYYIQNKYQHARHLDLVSFELFCNKQFSLAWKYKKESIKKYPLTFSHFYYLGVIISAVPYRIIKIIRGRNGK